MTLHITIPTNLFVPKRFKAYTVGFVILVRPEFRDNKGLMAHELVHVAQFWRNPLMGWFYRFSVKHRYKYELEAHQAQYRHSPELAVFLANNLTDNYNLKITFQQAYLAITGTEFTTEST